MGMRRVELYNLSCRCYEAFWVENSVGVHYSPCLLYIGKKKCRGTLFPTSIVEAIVSGLLGAQVVKALDCRPRGPTIATGIFSPRSLLSSVQKNE